MNNCLRELLIKEVTEYLSLVTGRVPAQTQATEGGIAEIYKAAGFSKPCIVPCDSPAQLLLLPSLIAILMRSDRHTLSLLRKYLTQFKHNQLLCSSWKILEGCEAVERVIHLKSFGRNISSEVVRQLKDISSLQSFTVQERLQVMGDLSPLTIFCRRLSEAIAVLSMPALVSEDGMLKQLAQLMDSLPPHSPDHDVVFVPESGDAHSIEMWFAPWSGEPGEGINYSELHANNRLGTVLAIAPDTHTRLREFSPYVSRSLGAIAAFSAAGNNCPPLVHAYKHLFAGGLLYLFYENVCIFCRLPQQASLDAGGRFHHDEAAAITMQDGAQYYAWHGTPVQPHIFRRRHQITARTIELQENAEVRRVMLEMYGMEKYLRKSCAKIINKDDFGVLYQKEFARGEPLTVVEVLNATPEPDGTRRRYLLRVPPAMRTAKEAVAWSFGLSEQEYEPDSES